MKKEICFIVLMLFALASCKKIESLLSTETVIYQNDLKVDDGTWTSDSTKVHVRKFYQGHYFLRVDSLNIISYSLAPYGTLDFPYSVQVDATAQLDDTNMHGNVGLVFNFVDKSNYNVFEISTSGTYHIWSRVDGDIEQVVMSTISSAIKKGSGSMNTIKLIQGTDSLEVKINNTSLGYFQVSIAYSDCKVGVSTSTAANEYTPVTGLFNNFILSKIDDTTGL